MITPSIAVCMIVKNEEQNIGRLLTSIKGFADEIILVDTGSEDRTVDIAKSFGAKIYYFPWCDDFSAARNESLRYATKDYILWLDADDEVRSTEHKKIRTYLSKKPGNAYYLRVKNIMHDHETESIQLRIFPNNRGIQFEGRIHEQVYQSIKRMMIPLSLCDATVIHHGYCDEMEMKKKLMRNKMLQERELKEKPDDVFALFFLARTLKGLNIPDEALYYLDRVIARGEIDTEIRKLDIFTIALIDKASLLLNRGMLDETLLLLETWEKQLENSTLIHYTLGEIYYKKCDYEKAYMRFLPLRNNDFREEILPLDVKKVKKNLLSFLGVSSLFVKDYDCARRCFNALIDNEPNDPSHYHYLALTEEKAGNVDGAIMVCTKAMDIFADTLSFVKRQFLLYIEKGDFQKALEGMSLLYPLKDDLEVMAGCFLVSCSVLSIEGINTYYHTLRKALFLPHENFPDGYPVVRERLISLCEYKALSLFDRAMEVLIRCESSIQQGITA